jgi:hypothetical protein
LNLETTRLLRHPASRQGARKGRKEKASSVTHYTQDDIDFSRARRVISAAQKFVVPVAAFGDADALVYPRGTEKAGEPITDWQGRPVGEKGIVFYNAVDKCYQAAPADGKSVIIINEVGAAQARDLQNFIGTLAEGSGDLAKASLERVIAHAQKDLGLVDIYNSTDAFVRAKMTPVSNGDAGAGGRPRGWHKREDRDICDAIYVRGPGSFQGPAATPQQIPAHGAFVLRQMEDGKPGYRMVDADVMLRTYLNLDGSRIALTDFADTGREL